MDLRIITSNVAADFTSPPGVPSWDERREPYVELLRRAGADVLSLQEVMPKQLRFLRAELAESRVLVVNYIEGEDGEPASSELRDLAREEISNPYEIALFYRGDRLKVVECGHWWMSPTPDTPSTGFGNNWPRVLVWSRFHWEVGDVIVFATHIDHRCVSEMLDVCRPRFDALADSGIPQIFAGDLNFNPEHDAYASLLSDGWCDSGQNIAPETSTFLYEMPNVPSGRIDHIFTRGSRLSTHEWSRLLPAPGDPPVSDHDPVLVRVGLM
jgi:endonuclease/exonuclease/phosphatase family metal-dependent hydrolase